MGTIVDTSKLIKMAGFGKFRHITRSFYENSGHLRSSYRKFTNIEVLESTSSSSNVVSCSRSMSQDVKCGLSSVDMLYKNNPDYQNIDPHVFVKSSIDDLADNIKKALQCEKAGLVQEMACYHFDGQGKSFRPLIVTLAALACNQHTRTNQGNLLQCQQRVAEIAEMIHTASLIHDDVIDDADTRRGKPSAQAVWGQKDAILSGVYILSVSSQMIARLNNNDVVTVLAQVLEDLVKGEFMQLGTEEDPKVRFEHYLTKTYKKTASLVANSCKAVAILSGAEKDVQEMFFEYGRNVGIAFQLVDDMLDFVSTESVLGKPAAADLKLGLATAPLLFASQQYPELDALVMRRFKQAGDVEHALKCVRRGSGLLQTRVLAEQYCEEALRQISSIEESAAKHALHSVIPYILNRLK